MASKRESMVVKSRDSLAVGLKSTRTELSSVHAALQNKSLELERTAFELQMMQVRGLLQDLSNQGIDLRHVR
jgi:hypothetical protein